MLACRLVALKKAHDVCPVGMGKIIRRLLSKYFLLGTGDKSTEACGNPNLNAGLGVGIEVAVHNTLAN